MKFYKLLLPVSVLAALAAGVLYLKQHDERETEGLTGIYSCNGRLEMKRVDVASLYAGRVDSVPVERGQSVSRGDDLVLLSSAVTEAQVKSVTAQKERALETVRKNDSRISQIDAEIKLAAIELDDAEHLRRDSLISRTELERRRTALTGKKSAREVILRERKESELEIARLDAMLEEAKSRNDDMTVKAPFDGVVEYRLAEPGNVVGAGGKVISLLNPDDVTLDVFLPTDRVAGVRVGDEARIVLDGIDAVIPARIDFIAEDAQFTPKYVETREERSKLLFKVTLRIPEEITRKNHSYLRGGMPAVGYVNRDGVPWPDNLAVTPGISDGLKNSDGTSD